MGLFDLFNPERALAKQSDQFMRFLQERAVEMSMVQNGWRVWHGSMSQAERDEALEAYLAGKQVQWYPPGYTEEPVITEGKLKLEKE
jgi:hypothetical protein